MKIICLDLEGVLVPEIWARVAKKTKIKELGLTTRDIPDYDVLMAGRITLLKKHNIKLKDIQKVIATIMPLPGAKKFLDTLRASAQVVILSDTFSEFASPLMKKLGWPTIFCNTLHVDSNGFIQKHIMRQTNGKQKSIEAFKLLGYEVFASGDSYNDIGMLTSAHRGFLFNPPQNIVKEYPQFKVYKKYSDLQKQLL